MKYRAGYKFVLAEDEVFQTDILGYRIEMPGFIKLDPDGKLTVYARYAWDGTSGPTWNDKKNKRGGCAHDAMSQLARAGLLPYSEKRKVDRMMVNICMKDGMCKLRAEVYYIGLGFASDYFTEGYEPYPVLEAP